jgi:hypothetical protein
VSEADHSDHAAVDVRRSESALAAGADRRLDPARGDRARIAGAAEALG